jgi:hypothetical protein
MLNGGADTAGQSGPEAPVNDARALAAAPNAAPTSGAAVRPPSTRDL